jgi:flavin-dependent dehydrogenase
MSTSRFDTIVVGARCAGASVAIHLARAGQKVLLLDAAKLPSDQPMSTHFVSPPGVDWLDELGVGAEVRRLSPPSCVVRLDLDGTALDIRFARGRAGHCLRRSRLDALLQDAAVAAGAILHDRTKVVGLLRESGRVVGVEADHEGSRTQHRARLVVGADGRNSSVAELAGANEYLGYDSPRFGYWAYWPAKPAWKSDPELACFDAYIAFGSDRTIRFVFQTDSNLLCIGATPLVADLPAWKGRHEDAYLEAIRSAPVTAKLVEDNQREGKLLGLLTTRFFFREAAGRGFALVGDAGLHKDPTPGYGITDALRDARNLGRAILAGDDAALARYWRQRDVDSIDLFHFARDLSDPNYVSPLNRLVYERAPASPKMMQRFAAQADRQLSPYEVLPTRTMLQWVLGASLRGRLSVIPSFLAAGKRNAGIERARKERLALLQQCGDPSAGVKT